MCQKAWCKCRAVVLFIKPIVFQSRRCRFRGYLSSLFFCSVIGCDPFIHCFPWLCSGLGAICMPLKGHLGLLKSPLDFLLLNRQVTWYFRAIMTHASVPKEQREVLGISDTLVSCTFATLETKRNLGCVNFRRILQCWSYCVKINSERHQNDTERTQNRAGL